MHCKLVPPFDFGSPLVPPFGRLSQWSVSLGSLWCSRGDRNWIRTNDLQVLSPHLFQVSFKMKKARASAFFILLRGTDSNRRPPGYEFES